MRAALANLGRREEALELYRRAEKLNPRSDAVVQGMATILIDTGKAQDALALLRKAIALNPRRPAAYEQLARLGELSGSELETARKFSANQNCLRLTPPHSNLPSEPRC